MRLRATIVIDVEAADFVEAADHQRMIEACVVDLKARYGEVSLDFRESRTARRGRRRTPTRLAPPPQLPVRMRPYVD